MVHFIWIGICSLLLFLQNKYKQSEINHLHELLDRAKDYIRQRSSYYTEKELDLKGKLKIKLVTDDISENNPIIIKFYEADGYEKVEAFHEKKICYYGGSSITKIESLSGHLFRFASDFEAGMEYQGATIYTTGKNGEEIPLETVGWEPHWILIFDK